MSKNNKVDYSQKILEVDNLKKYFTNGVGKNKLTVPAVDGLTFDIYKREVFGLVGESGCGKTTTGRTIIKLLAPTDGSAKLNGEKVVAGFRQHIERIKEIKVEAKEKILELNPYEAEKTRIERNRDSEVEILKAEIAETKLEMKDAIDKAKHPIGQYKTDKYNAKSAFDADVEKVNYRFHLDNKEIRKKTINEASREYNREFRGAQLGYKRKVEGLKESAALREDVVKNRIRELTEEYEAYYKELEQKYEPLIKESESKIISSDEAKQKISELKKIRDEKIKARKKQYAQDKSAISKPNKAEIKENISRITAEYKARINDIEKQIVDMKKEAAKKIEQIPESFKTEISKEEMKEKIAKINEWKKEAIHEQKVKVKEAKAANKSQEALEASRKMQMIFQDPISSLNPRMTVQEIVGEGLTIEGGHSKKEIKEKVGEVLELVGLSREYAARYPHEFSGGQRQRIGVARALIMDPDFIIADEPISALDVSIQAQVINLLSELRERLDLTMLFIAHDLSVVQFFCDRIAVMYYGKIVELASSEDLFENPMHPYTRSLLSSIPQPDPDYEKNRVRIAYDPGMHDYLRDKPSLREVKKDHFVYVNDAEFAKLQEELENKKSSKKEKVN